MNNASLELGGDNWAAKDTKLLAATVSDDSGRFYPQEFTFSRGSNLSATRVNADGNIEKGYENLLLQSNSFLTTWTQVSISPPTSGQAGYDGSTDAWYFEKTGAFGRLQQSISTSGVQTLSVYLKAKDSSWVNIEAGGTNTSRQYFNLTAPIETAKGSSSNIISSSIEDAGNGWRKCSITYEGTKTFVFIFIAEGNGQINGTSGSLYIQDAMLNQGLAALPYIESGSSAVKAGILENEPRIDYSSGTPSLLLEPSRTNLVPYSEYIQGLSLTDLTLTPNATTSPEGLRNAYKVLTGTAGSEQIASADNSTTGNVKTQSVYIKADSGVQWIRLIQIRYGFADSAAVWFDIQNGLKGSKSEGGTTSVVDDATKIEDAGNGWYRLILVCTDSTNNTTFDTRIRTAIADGSGTRVSNGSYFVWGLQMESNTSYPTSYIPNHSGGSVTRGADVCNNAGDSSTFNDSEGVLYAEISALADDFANYKFISLYDGTYDNFCDIYFGDATNRISARFRSGGGGVINMFFAVSDITALNKVAISWKLNEFKLFINGVSRGLNTSGAAPTGLNTLDFHQPSNANPFYGNVKQVLTFNTALSDADLETLTTI